jgi:hypothetical protein
MTTAGSAAQAPKTGAITTQEKASATQATQSWRGHNVAWWHIALPAFAAAALFAVAFTVGQPDAAKWTEFAAGGAAVVATGVAVYRRLTPEKEAPGQREGQSGGLPAETVAAQPAVSIVAEQPTLSDADVRHMAKVRLLRGTWERAMPDSSIAEERWAVLQRKPTLEDTEALAVLTELKAKYNNAPPKDVGAWVDIGRHVDHLIDDGTHQLRQQAAKLEGLADFKDALRSVMESPDYMSLVRSAGKPVSDAMRDLLQSPPPLARRCLTAIATIRQYDYQRAPPNGTESLQVLLDELSQNLVFRPS